MALEITAKENTSAPDSDYPFGNIIDDTGSEDGTPLNKLVHADFHQFFAKMLFESGIIPNNLPDNDYNGFQFYEALLAHIPYATIAQLVVDLDALELVVDGIQNPEAWIAPTLAANWTNAGAPDNPAGYFKTTTQEVRLKGLIKYTAGAPASNIAVFTLPSGYRPAFDMQFPVCIDGSANITSFQSNGFMTIKIKTTGEVILLDYLDTVNADYDLSSISFRLG